MLQMIGRMLEAVIVGLGVFFVLQLSIQPVEVQGASMDPTIRDGKHVMVNKLAYYRLDMKRLARLVPFWDMEEGSNKYLPFTHPPARGDVLVFHDPTKPGRDLIKRVVGLPGESVKIIEGVLYIDGVELDESYLDGVHTSGSMESASPIL